MHWFSFEMSLALLALAPLALVELAKAARWAALFGPHRPPFHRALRAEVAGQLTNALAPVRAGEVLRLGLIRAEGSGLAAATAAFVGAKALDALCLAAIAAAIVGSAALGQAGWGLAGGAGVLACGGVLACLASELRPALEAQSRLRAWGVLAVLDVASSLRSPRTLLTVLVSTGVVWAAGLAANAVVLAAVGITPRVDLAARVLVAGYLIGLLPAPPGRLGVFETGVTVALTSAGVGLPEALTAAVMLHVCQLAELALLMTTSLAVRRWSWSA